MPADTINDDSFYLYDLKVEVVCPPGKRILCGAKPGDHFTLQGEMLHLPPGQGISIYSLGIRCTPSPCRQAENDRRQRLDDHGCPNRMSRSKLSVTAENHPGGG
ncbi:hypothetical protein VFPFJ_10361 [Purpureocillium lilacinum]|uniref:Uncharacterized protein n=1 Tax=Purpureocillium lilacinum TaxID=33203 RepID=A0A179FP19_PURLI|nr:hypothetical protein VFPFJ_10361 [Purpureocillium lilacinum]OAQ67342.1 hypothetical protein VFPBJ_10937 [Purpureocillium lilacinum]OAQ77994.1 hypothetical protein VFPFJ_10361 [Purpureocillium lilacinum]